MTHGSGLWSFSIVTGREPACVFVQLQPGSWTAARRRRLDQAGSVATTVSLPLPWADLTGGTNVEDLTQRHLGYRPRIHIWLTFTLDTCTTLSSRIEAGRPRAAEAKLGKRRWPGVPFRRASRFSSG
jgi:hypothetical protein